ncbi:MAG: DUF192 domain-containing protein, partial [Candidatus Goldbacteria bacterium]|nr:DUF192 domain-containing protein [Candidatus Goldiibacteriota bacterium]
MRKINFIKFLFFILIVIFFFVLKFKNQNLFNCKKAVLNINNIQIELKIAKTDSERKLGLMFINKLPQNHGMLFIFDDEGEYTFWMKNT